MNARTLLYSLTLLLIFTSVSFSQSDQNDLKIFGFFQSSFFQHTSETIFKNPPAPTVSKSSNSFWQQQMNLLLSKNFGSSFTSFVNLKFTNSYSSHEGWGSFSIHEAWMKYQYSEALNIKAGLMLPKFNRLNEIKDRTVLFPYLFRPIVYEESLEGIIQIDAFIPENANLQVYGNFPVNTFKVDYAVFAGNSEAKYTITSNAAANKTGYPSSTDTTSFKLFGGRIGFQYGNLSVGATVTFDKSNQMDKGLGNIQRTRVGADIFYSVDQFEFEGELISVNYNLNDSKKAILSLLSASDPQMGSGLDKLFYYGNLTYNINDEFYLFVMYDYLKDEMSGRLNEGLDSYSTGAGYKPNDSLTIKTQFKRFDYKNKRYVDYSTNMYMVGISVFF